MIRGMLVCPPSPPLPPPLFSFQTKANKRLTEPTSTPAEPKPVVDEPASTTSTEEPKISTLPLNPKVVDTTAVTAVDELSSVEPATADPALQPKTEAEKAAVVDTNGTARDVDAGAAKDDGPLKFTHGEGTGELPIKSTSLKADGAEVDAATPEAGKEADREFSISVSGCGIRANGYRCA